MAPCDISLSVFNNLLTQSRSSPPKMVRLVPRDTKFFDMFAEMASNLGEGARLLKQMLDDFQNIEARVAQLKDIEHRGDDMTHNILTKLNQTFTGRLLPWMTCSTLFTRPACV